MVLACWPRVARETAQSRLETVNNAWGFEAGNLKRRVLAVPKTDIVGKMRADLSAETQLFGKAKEVQIKLRASIVRHSMERLEER